MEQIFHVGLSHYLVVSAILFTLGLFAIVTRKNAVMVLMGLELILNSANINFMYKTINIQKHADMVDSVLHELAHLIVKSMGLKIKREREDEAAEKFADMLNHHHH